MIIRRSLALAICSFALTTHVSATVVDRPSPGEIPLGVVIKRGYDKRGDLRKIEYGDTISESYSAWAVLRRGRVIFSIRVRRENERSSVLFGRDVIRIALHEFGSRVRLVEACWTEGDNRRQYDDALAAGRSKREAAAGTWTARQLRRAGFTSQGRVRRFELYRGTEQVSCAFRRPLRRRCADALTKVRARLTRFIE